MTINKTLYSLFFLIPIGMATGSLIPDLLLTLISLIFLFYSIRNKLWKYYKNNFFYFLCVFWVILIIGSLLSNGYIHEKFNNKLHGSSYFNTIKSSVTYIRFIIFSVAVYYLSINYSNFYKHTYRSFFIALSVALFFAYFQLLTGYTIFFDDITILFSEGIKEPYERISGLFGDELVLGGFLIRTLPLFCIFYFLSNKLDKKKTYSFITLFMLTAVMIFFAGERSALALLLFFMGLSFILIKEYRFLFFKVGIFFLIIISTVTIYKKDIRERYFVHTLNDGFFKNGKLNVFSEQHQNHYRAAIRIFFDYPIKGSGVKMFRYLCLEKKYYDGMRIYRFDILENGQNFEKTIPSPCGTHPHNTWIQVLSESGVLGFSLLLFFYFFVIKESYIMYRKKNLDNFDKGKLLILIFYITVLWPIIPSGSFFTNWISISYYIPLGILMNYREKKFNK